MLVWLLLHIVHHFSDFGCMAVELSVVGVVAGESSDGSTCYSEQWSIGGLIFEDQLSDG